MSDATADLLWEIADCGELRRCKERPGSDHPRQAIVDLQADVSWEGHQRPEPWNGALEAARILFVSSNPSIDGSEPYPTRAWERGQLEPFFERRLEDQIVDGTRPRKKDGAAARKPVPYLNEVLRIACDLLGGPAAQGVDTRSPRLSTASRQAERP